MDHLLKSPLDFHKRGKTFRKELKDAREVQTKSLSKWKAPLFYQPPAPHGEKSTLLKQPSHHPTFHGVNGEFTQAVQIKSSNQVSDLEMLNLDLDVECSTLRCVNPHDVNPLVITTATPSIGTASQQAISYTTSTTEEEEEKEIIQRGIARVPVKLEMEEFGDLSAFLPRHCAAAATYRPAGCVADELNTPVFDRKGPFDFTIYENTTIQTPAATTTTTSTIQQQAEDPFDKFEYDIIATTNMAAAPSGNELSNFNDISTTTPVCYGTKANEAMMKRMMMMDIIEQNIAENSEILLVNNNNNNVKNFRTSNNRLIYTRGSSEATTASPQQNHSVDSEVTFTSPQMSKQRQQANLTTTDIYIIDGEDFNEASPIETPIPSANSSNISDSGVQIFKFEDQNSVRSADNQYANSYSNMSSPYEFCEEPEYNYATSDVKVVGYEAASDHQQQFTTSIITVENPYSNYSENQYSNVSSPMEIEQKFENNNIDYGDGNLGLVTPEDSNNSTEVEISQPRTEIPKLRLNLANIPGFGNNVKILNTPDVIESVVDLETSFNILDYIDDKTITTINVEDIQFEDPTTSSTVTAAVLPTLPNQKGIISDTPSLAVIDPRQPNDRRKRKRSTRKYEDSDEEYLPPSKKSSKNVTGRSNLDNFPKFLDAASIIAESNKRTSDLLLESEADRSSDSDDDCGDITSKKLSKRGRPSLTHSRRTSSVSSEHSDASKYRELRDKNNEASRRSRLKRKMKEQYLEEECDQLSERNIKLKTQVTELEKMVETFKNNLFRIMMNKK